MKKCFYLLFILFLFSCNFDKTINFTNSNKAISLTYNKGDLPTDFNVEPKVFELKTGYNIAILSLNDLNNRITELRITSSTRQNYSFIIKISNNDIDKIFYLNAKFYSINDIGGYAKGGVFLTFLDASDYNTIKASKQLYNVIAVPLYTITSHIAFNGWYKLKKTKNSHGNEVPILVKL